MSIKKLLNQKKAGRIITGSIVYLIALLPINVNQYIELMLYVLAFMIIGHDIVIKAIKNIINGQLFDESFLMSIATIGAFLINEYAEGVAVMLFYQIGELFQSMAVAKSRQSIAQLMDIRPDHANLVFEDKVIVRDPEDIKINDIILIRPQEKIPLDAIIIEGSSTIDTSALTGESLPKDVTVNDKILSGCININGVIKAKVTKVYSESTVSKILDLVENAESKKAKTEAYITKLARYYTPLVVLLAFLLVFVPTILYGWTVVNVWLYRALIFLVISCPCALVISIPLSFFGGIGGASRNGILIKGGNYLEVLAKTKTVIFDKTGTLTKGTFVVKDIVALSMDQEELLMYAAYAEAYSNHPIAMSIKKAYTKQIDERLISNVKEVAGNGLVAEIANHHIAIGNASFIASIDKQFKENISVIDTILYMTIDQKYAGYITIADQIKEDAYQTIKGLHELGINKTVMLTGDIKAIGEQIAKSLDIDEVYTQLLPDDKLQIMEKMMANRHKDETIIYVGDGINDAPVLARADVGIAMGGLGSDAAIEAADVVLMLDEPIKILTAIMISRNTIKIVKQNIVLALSVKSVVMILGALGKTSMWAAVFADVGVTIIAVLNAIRLLSLIKK